jgi:hypothetical protein
MIVFKKFYVLVALSKPSILDKTKAMQYGHTIHVMKESTYICYAS